MRSCFVVFVGLLVLALLAGCYLLVGFAFSQYCSIAGYARDDEMLLQIKMMGIPAFVVGVVTMVLGPVSLLQYRSKVLGWIWRLYGLLLWAFSAELVAVAERMNRSSSGEGAGLIIILTGPIILFALVVPTVLGAIALMGPRLAKPEPASE